MNKLAILTAIKRLNYPIFTTGELSKLSGGTLSNTTQALKHLQRKDIVSQIKRGLWMLDLDTQKINPYMLIPFLFSHHRAYLSFISALHLYGIVEQIPQVITLASTSHTRIIQTQLGVFYVHRIAPSFFKGFDWYKGTGNFLIAEQEKALIDCLYISARKKKQFGYFPELYISKSFSFNKARKWVKQIPNDKIRISVMNKLEKILSNKTDI